MHFLKKASIEDILQQSGQEKQFRTEIDITSHYKEFELYLSHDMLARQCDNNKEYYKKEFYKKEKEYLKKIEELAKELQTSLIKNNAVISAIHVPESLFKTSCDKARGKEFSSNYLSLCEAIWDNESYEVLEFCIRLAARINKGQYLDDRDNKNPIIVILHAGCMKGCLPEENSCKLTDAGHKAVNRFIDKLKKIDIETNLKIAIENVTPYYDESKGDAKEKLGENCGWNCGQEQKRINQFLKKMNDKIMHGAKDEEKRISFGLCIDFCHIFASYILKKTLNNDLNNKNKELCDAMDHYFSVFQEMEQQVDIYLFHVSQYGENGEHGKLFQYEKDAELVEKIQQLCYRYAPQAAITLEMMDGHDREKACKKFDDMMYLFSAMHTKGEFAALLSAEGNEELKEFLEELFWIYASDGKDSFKLSQMAWRVKAYILKNLHPKQDEEVLFGFTPDENIESTALFRLKAYIYYTRFCNLGIFLAENYYKKFPFSEKNKAEDFRLTMNYFMLNDKMEQCVYTGVAYKFNINFLPHKETFYRFNDGIEDDMVKKMEVKGNEEVFPQIVKMILDQINGSSLKLYSVGKNFGQCLFKYYNPHMTEWTLRIYENVPINYIEYNGRKYSIPAFLQIQETLDLKGESIGFAIDMSLFSKGRDGEKTSSLNGFFKNIIGREISKERVATISDEEIVLTQLPDCAYEYKISLPESMLLKEAYLHNLHRKKTNVKYIIDLDKAKADDAGVGQFMDSGSMKIIMEMKDIEDSNQIGEIIEKVNKHVCNDISREKNSNKDLIELKTYSSSECNKQFETIRKYIKPKEEGSTNDEG